ncbi:hypothetical protein GCM10010415_67070 [Streptomyces atrovirens]
MGVIVFLFPLGEFSAGWAAVRNDEAGARVAAVGDGGGPADGGLRSRFLPGLAAVAVAGHRASDRHDQSGVGVDDDLVVGGVLVVLRLLGDGVVDDPVGSGL